MAPHYRDKENDELVFILISLTVIWFFVFCAIAIGGPHG